MKLNDIPEDVKVRLSDPLWRLTHLYRIIDKQSVAVKFKPNRAQRYVLENRGRRNVYLKGRQLGLTTLAAMELLDGALFNEHFRGVLIAHDEKSMYQIFKKIRFAWRMFPLAKFGWSTIGDKSNEITFNNGSSVSVMLSTRSDTVNHLHVSEFGKMCRKYPDKAEEVITGAMPSVPPNGRIDIESTAEGDTGYFYDMFWEGFDDSERSMFKSMFLPWTLAEEYTSENRHELSQDLQNLQQTHKLTDGQINWYFETAKQLKEKMPQEYPLTPEEAFLSSGNKVFDIESLKRALNLTVEGRKVGNWTYYSDYKPGHSYAMGSDVGEGVGLDSSTIVVVDFTPRVPEVVAVFADNSIPPNLLAYELRNAAEKYGNCLVAPERNNVGHATVAKLAEFYSNIYKERTVDRLTNRETDRIGWLTTGKNKAKIIFELKTAMEEGYISIPDKRILREMMTYDNQDLRELKAPEDTTRHFDLLMALAIAWEMRYNVEMGYDESVYLSRERISITEELNFDPFRTV